MCPFMPAPDHFKDAWNIAYVRAAASLNTNKEIRLCSDVALMKIIEAANEGRIKPENVVPSPGLEPGPREGPPPEDGVSTNSTKRANADGLYHGSDTMRKDPVETEETTLPHDDQSAGKPKQAGVYSMEFPMDGFGRRLRDTYFNLLLPFGWNVDFVYDSRGYWYLQVEDPHGTNNVTNEPYTWKGRKWLLSPHMTEGEIVQTAFMATLAAAEHEIRETFMYKGRSIFDPHYDLDKLVELRAEPDAIKGRDGETA